MLDINQVPLLSTLIFIPLFGGLLSFAFKNRGLSRTVAIFFTLVQLAFNSILILLFDKTEQTYQFIEKIKFSVHFNLSYFLGVDGIAVMLITLTNILMLLILIYENRRNRLFYASFMFLQSVTIGLFSSLDVLFFYIFLESSLVIMFFIIAIWGGSNRLKAVFKYCFYSLLAGSFLLVSILYVQYNLGCFSVVEWQTYIPELLTKTQKEWIFWIFVLSFGVKVPLIGVHFWLPEAHSQAPTGGSVFLSGILLKLGIFSFLRFVIPIFPDLIAENMQILFAISLIGIFYSGLLALIEQKDIKKIIAYSSILHMNLIMLALFSLNKLAARGAVVQMVSHGFVVAGMFFTVGIILKRLKKRDMDEMVNLQKYMPRLSFVFMILLGASVGLPLSGDFVGKTLSVFGVLEVNTLVGIMMALAGVLSLAYLLRFYNNVFCNDSRVYFKIEDLNKTEMLILMPIVFFIFLIGVCPNIIFDITQSSLDVIIK